MMKKIKLIVILLCLLISSVSQAARKTKIVMIDGVITDVSCVDTGQSCLDDVIIKAPKA